MGRTQSNSKAVRMTCHQQRWESRAPGSPPFCCLLRESFGGRTEAGPPWTGCQS